MDPTQSSTAGNIDAAELHRFARIADDWWNPSGKFRPLHKLGPARLGYIRDRVVAHFGRNGGEQRPLAGLAVLDIGCGGGLISEPLCRMGASVTGIEPTDDNIGAARNHAAAAGLVIDYRSVSAEDLAAGAERYDVVVCLEVIEHVPDPSAFVATCARLTRPGGLVVLSTINRTVKAYVLAIVGAEYVLRWLPVGTHQWERFVTPEELGSYATAAGLDGFSCEGLVYNPLADRWGLGRDTDVNYIGCAAKPG